MTSSRHALVQAAHQDVEIDSNLADAFAVAREPDEQAMPQEARLCDDASSLPWRPMLRELRFDGAATTSDQSHHSDGWTDTSVVASGGAAAMVPAIAMPQFKNEIAETRTSEHSTLARVEQNALGAASWTRQRLSPRAKREPSYTESGFFGKSVLDVSSDDSVCSQTDTREGSLYFPPRKSRSQRRYSATARHRLTRGIHRWMTSRANDRDPGLVSDIFIQDLDHPGKAHAPSTMSSESSFDPFEVEVLWRQLVSQRRLVSKIRRSAARARFNLSQTRPQLSQAENQFMAMIRPFTFPAVTRQHSPQQLESQFAGLQELRDNHRSLELDYEEMETRLGKEESRLCQVENRFYEVLATLDDAVGDSETMSLADEIELDMPLELQGIGPDRPMDVHPLYERLQEAAARQKHWGEEYSGLWEGRDRYEDEIFRSLRLQEQKSQILRDQPDTLIPRTATGFFEDFATSEARIKQRLEESTRDVKHFVDLCQQKGVMAKRHNALVWAILNPGSHSDEEIDLGNSAQILASHDRLTHPAFPSLLSQPNHLLEDPEPLTSRKALQKMQSLPDSDPEKPRKVQDAQKEVEIDGLLAKRDGMTAATFVNQWILFTLRISALDAALLFSIFLKRLSVRNVTHWQHDVLRYWNEDGLSSRMEQNEAYMDESDYFVATLPRSRATTNVPANALARPPRDLGRAQSSSAILENHGGWKSNGMTWVRY